jgi:hypothetical protein
MLGRSKYDLSILISLVDRRMKKMPARAFAGMVVRPSTDIHSYRYAINPEAHPSGASQRHTHQNNNQRLHNF